jgi:hypothetical protein
MNEKMGGRDHSTEKGHKAMGVHYVLNKKHGCPKWFF